MWILYSTFISLHIVCAYASNPEFRELDKFIKHVVKCQNIVGLSLSLVKGNHCVFSRGYGHVSGEGPDWGEKATEHTEFCIGSLTKAFTSTILASVLSKQDRSV